MELTKAECTVLLMLLDEKIPIYKSIIHSRKLSDVDTSTYEIMLPHMETVRAKAHDILHDVKHVTQ